MPADPHPVFLIPDPDGKTQGISPGTGLYVRGHKVEEGTPGSHLVLISHFASCPHGADFKQKPKPKKKEKPKRPDQGTLF